MKKFITLTLILLFIFSCSKEDDKGCECELIALPENPNINSIIARPCEFEDYNPDWKELISREQAKLISSEQGC